MKRKLYPSIVLSLLSLLLVPYSVQGQTTVSQIDQIVNAPTPQVGQIMSEKISPESKVWLSETMLDSIDQTKIPKIVTMGVIFNANLSNFIIYQTKKLNSSYMRIGMELGGTMNFLVQRHFAIEAQLVFTAEQNHFKQSDIKDNSNYLWSIGADIPVLFLYHLGSMDKGYFNVGAGIFAHFTFANNLGVYQNVESAEEVVGDYKQPSYVSLHDNHAGLMAHVGYEFPFGMQLNLNYLVSLTDIFGYYQNTKGTAAHDAAFYPQRVSFGLGYRWK